jgi:hypothetical protein
MYKVEIKIGDIFSEDVVTIESSDFEKIQILQEFIELQENNGWAVDYHVDVEFLEENDEEEINQD